MKRPAFMFYPADWRKDPELRVCSVAARGLWIDMIAWMHEGAPYGHLVVNGSPLSNAQLARLVGESPTLIRRLLSELESHNVFSRTDLGVIYSRRMVADEVIRNARAEAGKLGGNPALLVKHEDKQEVNQTAKQNLTPSVAVAVAVASAVEQTNTPPSARAVIFDARTELLNRLDSDKRPAWAAELSVAADGMHGPALTPEQVETACRDFIANGGMDAPNLKHFRGYLRNHASPAVVTRTNGLADPDAYRQWAIEQDAIEEAERVRAAH